MFLVQLCTYLDNFTEIHHITINFSTIIFKKTLDFF